MVQEDGITLGTKLRILNAGVAREEHLWLQLWQAWEDREVFAHPGYVRLFASSGHHAMCAALQSSCGNVLYPFILRDLTREPWWSLDMPRATDITTPYGYGGPFVWGETERNQLAANFWQAFNEFVYDQCIVSEFVRFSLFPEQVMPYPGKSEAKRLNVVRDLSPSEDVLWMDFEHKVRKNVKKAQRSGVEVISESTGMNRDHFMRLYAHTLNRRDGTQQYYFPQSFFDAIHGELSGQFMYFHALYEGKIVSTELVLVSEKNVYSFLGGTDQAAFHVRPNDLIKLEIIKWARDNGKHNFVLGGGFQPEDGIYRYKLAFAPHGGVPFVTGQRILNPERYNALVETRANALCSTGAEISGSPDFFPAYRKPALDN